MQSGDSERMRSHSGSIRGSGVGKGKAGPKPCARNSPADGIEAGEECGIVAGLYIKSKENIKCGLKIFAGICTWKELYDEEKTITCGKLEGGKVGYGILNEVGIISDKVKIICEGKEVEISRESAKALNLI